MSRLTDRRGGFVADALRRRTEGTGAQRLAEAEYRLDRMERSLAYRVRAFRGIAIESHGLEIVPDARGFLAFSSDANLSITRDPNKLKNHAKWKLTADIPEAGCPAAITTNIDCDSNMLAADACGATVTHISGDQYVAVHVGGSANAQTLTYFFCTPEIDSPAMGMGGWDARQPDGWVAIPVGEPCAGECAIKKVPYWVDHV